MSRTSTRIPHPTPDEQRRRDLDTLARYGSPALRDAMAGADLHPGFVEVLRSAASSGGSRFLPEPRHSPGIAQGVLRSMAWRFAAMRDDEVGGAR